jgi:hypothetical protein
MKAVRPAPITAKIEMKRRALGIISRRGAPSARSEGELLFWTRLCCKSNGAQPAACSGPRLPGRGRREDASVFEDANNRTEDVSGKENRCSK